MLFYILWLLTKGRALQCRSIQSSVDWHYSGYFNARLCGERGFSNFLPPQGIRFGFVMLLAAKCNGRRSAEQVMALARRHSLSQELLHVLGYSAGGDECFVGGSERRRSPGSRWYSAL